jgi:hypothetical protein
MALAAHTRAIADGVVWKALGYDRGAITVLGRGTSTQVLLGDLRGPFAAVIWN